MPPQGCDSKQHSQTQTDSAPPVAVILGIPFHNVSFTDTVEWVRDRVHSRRPGYIATANMDFVTQAWRDPELQRILLEADLVVADGIPIVWLSRLLGHPLKERVTGSDLVPLLAELASRENFSIYGLGGAEGVAEKALGKLSARFPGMRIAGFHSPPKADIIDMDNPGILARIAAANPDILLVAFGGPKQEKWCNMHIRQWNVPVAIGIGGSLDFLAGVQTRAPHWVQRLALEWLWRMFSDPRRLFVRYVSNIAFFLAAVVRLLRLRWGPVPSNAQVNSTMAALPATGRESAMHRVAFPATATGSDANTFRTACEAEPTRPLLVDMGARDWLDSKELGELLALNQCCHSLHRWVCVLASHPRLAHMLRFVRLDRYILVATSLPEALHKLDSWKQTARNGMITIQSGHRLAIALPEELTAVNVAGFRKDVDAAWAQSVADGELTTVSVDASSLGFLDSAGIGFLMALRKKSLALSGGFHCVGFHGNARQTLTITRVATLFTDNPPPGGGAP